MLKELQNARLAASIKAIAMRCSDSEYELNEVLRYVGSSDSALAAKAAWVLSNAYDINPLIMGAEQNEKLLSLVHKKSHQAVKRNAMRIWQHSSIPEELTARVADLAFSLLADPSEDIAVRAFAISVLENCVITIPELREEVLFILEKELPYGSAAIQVRIKRFMKNTA